jgi:hypothetical protein
MQTLYCNASTTALWSKMRIQNLGNTANGDSWRELRRIFDAAVADKAKVEAQRLKASLHSLQTQNELLHHENNGLTRALEAKKKHKTKSKTMDLQRGKSIMVALFPGL